MNSDLFLDSGAIENLKELEKDDPGVIADLVNLFVTSAPKRFAEIRAALASGDKTALKFSAHSLKASCGNFGAIKMYELCKQLELETSKQPDSADLGAAALIEEIESEYLKLKPVLENLKDGKI